MTIKNVKIDGRSFVVVPKQDFTRLQQENYRMRRMLAADDSDLREARRRVKDPKRKSIPLSRLKAQLGL